MEPRRDTSAPASDSAHDEALRADRPAAPSPSSSSDVNPTSASPTRLQAEADDTVPRPSPSSGALPAPTVGEYRLIKRIGEGAMGAVFKGRHVGTNKKVAVKVLHAHIAQRPKSVERFCREARIMMRLQHPNIVRGFAVGEQDGMHFFAMEYVNGGSALRWLAHLGRFPVGDAVSITIACARALGHAHSLDLIHRDVKPENVLLTRSGEVKLADLGMAKLLDEDMSLTQTGHGVGTPLFMPLEQARNAKEADGRADIYALGGTLYMLLTGRPPFTGDLVELIQAKQRGTFPPARRFNPDVPERLDLVLLKMLARQPEQRYQNCEELIRDLESLELAGETLSFLAARSAKRAPDSSATIPSPPATSVAPEASSWWDVRYKTTEGNLVTRRLTTEQVQQLIQEPDFDLTAQARRQGQAGYRALASYGEFTVLCARLTRATLDSKPSKLRELYEDADERMREREIRERLERMKAAAPTKMPPWLRKALWMLRGGDLPPAVAFAAWAAVAAIGGGVLLFLLVRLLSG